MKKIAIILVTVLCLSLVSCVGVQPGGTEGGGISYTVNFDAGEGSPVPSQKTSVLNEAPKTEREGYVFCGWFYDMELSKAVKYPMVPEHDTTLYAKWTKGTDTQRFEDAAVQFSVENDYSFKADYFLDPGVMDVKMLADLGVYVRIDVTYEVYYEKTYNMPLDIGYLGAPDHNVYILDIYDEGERWENLSTETESKTETFSAVVSATKLANDLRLRLTTLNLQNVVYFKNISVTYTCQTSV